MTKKQEEFFIGTHARITLSDWSVLADLILKHTKLIKEKSKLPDEEKEAPNLAHVISRREIEDAINGPMQAFFKQKMNAYMKLSRVRMHLNMMEDDTFKSRRADLEDKDKVPENILQNTSLSDLTKIQNELDEKTTEHAQAWDQLREAAIQNILERLNEQGLSLSEIERKEFTDPEPISELMDRFVALNIELPKIKKTDMNFSNYFTLKADITIQSALSRQHMPHAQTDIQKILNKLKSDFNAIAKQEAQLIEEQKKSTTEIIANISW